MKTRFLVLLVILLLGAIVFYMFKNDKQEKIAEQNIEKKSFDCETLNYSRVSFFNTSKNRISLNIPDDWEGQYRFQENGDQVIFYFLNQAGQTNRLFSIQRVERLENQTNIICQTEDSDFVVTKNSLLNIAIFPKVNDYLKCIWDSVKCY